MNKAILAIAAAAMTLSGTLATAQPYGRGYDQPRGYERSYERQDRDSDRDGRSDAREWNRDRDRDGRPDQYDRYDNRRGGYDRGGHDRYAYDRSYRGRHSAWREGQRYPYYGRSGYVISDYRAYRLPPPRPGYRYYRGDNGDVVMVAIASGLIGAIIGNALSDR